MRSGLLGLAIGLALADSSIVTLALPEVLRQFDVGITSVAWVLTSYNLVLAVVAVPAAYVARRRPRPVFVVGAITFAFASLACGLATSFEMLVGARCIQAAGGALVVTSALDLLSQTSGSEARAARVWVSAGVLGAALGPAAGGILTELLGWESIFLVQVPLSLAALLAVHGLAGRSVPRPAGPPRWAPNAALLLLSGGLVAALFLVVLLLVDGWGLSPAQAGLVVTVMPLAAIVSARFTRHATSTAARIAAGTVLVAGGLTCLAVLPRAGWAWTIAPQLLVGAGIGLALLGLTDRAVAGQADQVVHGGWTLAARHAGVVLGLLLLAPVLTSALDRNEDHALRAGAAAVLDSAIPPLDKLGVAQDVLEQVEASGANQRPDLEAAFGGRPDADSYGALLSTLRDELDRAVTNAFSGPFLLAAALALAALVPIRLGRGAPL